MRERAIRRCRPFPDRRIRCTLSYPLSQPGGAEPKERVQGIRRSQGFRRCRNQKPIGETFLVSLLKTSRAADYTFHRGGDVKLPRFSGRSRAWVSCSLLVAPLEGCRGVPTEALRLNGNSRNAVEMDREAATPSPVVAGQGMVATKERPPWAVSGRPFHRRLRPPHPVTLTLPTAAGGAGGPGELQVVVCPHRRPVLPEPRGDVAEGHGRQSHRDSMSFPSRRPLALTARCGASVIRRSRRPEGEGREPG